MGNRLTDGDKMFIEALVSRGMAEIQCLNLSANLAYWKDS